jgi:hypothetical protein
MLANHTSMAQLFQHTVSQYDKLRKRNAFLEQYRREPMFQDGLEEFDSARYVDMLPALFLLCVATTVNVVTYRVYVFYLMFMLMLIYVYVCLSMHT